MNLLARFLDWCHERRINRLYRAHITATKRNAPHDERMRTWREFQRAVYDRSPAMVRRLEKQKGLA